MGQSTNAYLFYGVTAEEEVDWEEITDWFKTECGDLEHIELDFHCSGECMIPFFSTEVYMAYRGYPAELGSNAMDMGDHLFHEELEELVVRLEECGSIDDFSKIGWYLASYWG